MTRRDRGANRSGVPHRVLVTHPGRWEVARVVTFHHNWCPRTELHTNHTARSSLMPRREPAVIGFAFRRVAEFRERADVTSRIWRVMRCAA